MNDKERILMAILDRLSITQTLCLHGSAEAQFTGRDGHEYVHFGGYDDRNVQAGDLVLAMTGGLSDWKVGWVHEVIDGSTCIIREIGSNRLCNYGNERFVRIVGMDSSLLLEMDEYDFDQKVRKAFRRGDEYVYRYGGVEFREGGVAVIWIREVFGGLDLKKTSQPFSVEIKWDKKTSIKAILDAMRAGGYGTREFEKKEVHA